MKTFSIKMYSKNTHIHYLEFLTISFTPLIRKINLYEDKVYSQ